ncbi:MAG: SDR family oxidoreductase [bacterium]
MIIENGSLKSDQLSGRVAIITGAGRGIGFETARSLLWLGAKVIIAEVNRNTGRESERKLCKGFGPDKAWFIQTDVGNLKSIVALKRKSIARFNKVDIVVNNASITPMGAVKDCPIGDWDKSYQVNLRGPVFLSQTFLPGMLKRQSGVLVFISSVGLAHMGAYETFKAAQVHLAETLDAELEGSGIYTLCISPGLVHTPGSLDAIRQLAPLYGKTVEEFYEMNADQILSVEAAGKGIAAAIAQADKLHGQDISPKQALTLSGITFTERKISSSSLSLSDEDRAEAVLLCSKVLKTISEQSIGWQGRPVFERQWMYRDFRKNAGMSVGMWIDNLKSLKQILVEKRDGAVENKLPLWQLIDYYIHLQKLHADYEKNPEIRNKQAAIIEGWRKDVENLKMKLRL